MGYIIRRLLALVSASVMLWLQAVPVMALEGNSNPPGASLTVQGSSLPNNGASEVSSWEELTGWLKANSALGGTVRLAAPIAFDEPYAKLVCRAPVVIDLAGYSLTVSGTLDVYAADITIKAQGGENASMRVLRGGSLEMMGVTVETGSGGASVWQDEGAVLTLDPQQDGTVHYAVQPVAKQVESSILPAIVAAGDNAAESLPPTVKANVNYNGELTIEELPVVWDLANEQTAKSIAERRRTTIKGSFAGVETFGEVGCVLVFPDRPVTLLETVVKEYKGSRSMGLLFTSPASPMTVETQYSFDDENWSVAEQDVIEQDDEPQVTAYFYEPSIAEEGDLVWDIAANPKLYLRLCWLDAPEGVYAYSDELAIDGDTLEISSDTGGNRGGGTGLGPSDTLPPVVEDGAGIGGDDSSSGDSKLPEVTPPSGDDASSSTEVTSERTPTTKAVNNDKTEKLELVELQPAKPTAALPVTVEEAKDDKPLPQAETPNKAINQAETAQAVPEVQEFQQPPASTKAVGQIALGSIAVAGIIALTICHKQLFTLLRNICGRIINKN